MNTPPPDTTLSTKEKIDERLKLAVARLPSCRRINSPPLPEHRWLIETYDIFYNHRRLPGGEFGKALNVAREVYNLNFSAASYFDIDKEILEDIVMGNVIGEAFFNFDEQIHHIKFFMMARRDGDF